MGKMHYNKKKIMKIVDRYVEFGNDEDDFTTENFAINNYEELFKKFDVKSGVTKLVLIPRQGDYVIKIPFYGEMDIEEYWGEDEEGEEICECEEYFREFCDAPYRKSDRYCYNDYCWCEVELYKYAKKCGVEQFFAETRLIGKTFPNCHPVYVQEKLPQSNYCKYQRISNSEVEKTKTQVRENYGHYGVSEYFLTEVRLHNDTSTFDKLMDFIVDYNLDDVHENNWGYRDGKAMLLDYSGFFG